MDFFARRPGHTGSLAAENARFGVGLLRTIGADFRRAIKAVAITLKVERRGAGKLLKHLRLTAFVGDVREQPLHIALGQRMVAEGEKVTAEQARLIALAADHAGLGLMTLKRSQAVALRGLGLESTAGVGVTFKRALFARRTVVGLHDPAGFFEIIIATERAVGARLQAHLKMSDRRLLRHHPAAGHVRRRPFKGCKCLLFIAEYQLMAVRRMAKVVVKTLFKTQPLNKVQVRLPVLHAILSWRVIREPGKGVPIAENTVLFQHLLDDLLHRQVLENPMLGAMRQVSQAWHQRQAVMRQPCIRAAAGDAFNLAVDAVLRVER
ncbi:hypothetical protein AP059_00024 [Pseudomonas sp. TAA207]|nr:hypothetical protein AP059_00024 [Pseudomonas sp. TAA207]